MTTTTSASTFGAVEISPVTNGFARVIEQYGEDARQLPNNFVTARTVLDYGGYTLISFEP